jgi:hypothetical protein
MLIRAEEPKDRTSVFAVDASACETPAEARRVDVPVEAFMRVELQPGTLRGASGTIRYPAAFNTYERAADQPMKRPKGAARNRFSKGGNPQAQPEGPRFPGNSPCASR